jgi:hypothetical protein
MTFGTLTEIGDPRGMPAATGGNAEGLAMLATATVPPLVRIRSCCPEALRVLDEHPVPSFGRGPAQRVIGTEERPHDLDLIGRLVVAQDRRPVAAALPVE